ncbi:MAG: tripartite tricarboxylate transporter permease [Rhizobiaceae bacterium]
MATLLIATAGGTVSRFGLVFGRAEFRSGPRLGVEGHHHDVLGLALSTVGTDVETGIQKMTLGMPFLYGGGGFSVLATGLFGVSEVMRNIEDSETRQRLSAAFGRFLPGRRELQQSAAPIARGTVVGSLLGILYRQWRAARAVRVLLAREEAVGEAPRCESASKIGSDAISM